MNNALKTKLLFEISQIDKLLNESSPLIDLCKLKEPDFIEISACAMILHSFYNGIENILVLIFKHYDGKLPQSNRWHMELLEKAFVSDETRKQVFINDLQNSLEEYMKFRHFVRHSYGFQLEWERMEDLIIGMENCWVAVKQNLSNFMENV